MFCQIDIEAPVLPDGVAGVKPHRQTGTMAGFGESAGGTNVVTLLVSPLANGLFHRAVVQSGSTRSASPDEAENFRDAPAPGKAMSSGELLLALLREDGSAADRASAKTQLAAMSDAEVADYLRGKSPAAIYGAYGTDATEGLIQLPRIFRDGAVLPSEEFLARLGRAGGYNRVPVILGTNRDENKLFMFGDPAHVQTLFWIFPRLRDPQNYAVTAEYLSNMWKATGADEPAAAMRAIQGPSVFVYRFDWDEEPTLMFTDLSELLGAAHGFEIPFVFGHYRLGRRAQVLFDADNEPGRLELGGAMMSYWAEFAYHGYRRTRV